MPQVKIFRRDSPATQSGRSHLDEWVAEFEMESVTQSDGEMRWGDVGNTNRQLRLCFETQEAAEAWAKRNGHHYRVMLPLSRKVKPKAYADNFAHDRIEPWTH